MEKRIGLVQQGINSTSVSIKSLSGKATPFTEMTVFRQSPKTSACLS